MNTLKLEGAKDNIKVNAICPVAATRMTENLMPPQVLEMLKPEYVTPGVVFLASEDAPTGVILTAGAGIFSSAQIVEIERHQSRPRRDADTVARILVEDQRLHRRQALHDGRRADAEIDGAPAGKAGEGVGAFTTPTPPSP